MGAEAPRVAQQRAHGQSSLKRETTVGVGTREMREGIARKKRLIGEGNKIME